MGIVGLGNIGSQLAVLAEAMGMRVIYYDLSDKLRHGNVEPSESLNSLLARSDVVSLHVPETPETQNMIRAAEIALMKPGAFLINNARGTVVDLDALAQALHEKPARGRGYRRVSQGALIEQREISIAATEPAERNLDPSYRRLN